MRKILYLVSRSPFLRAELASTLRLVRPGDGLVFLQDGVVAVASLPIGLWDQVRELAANGTTIYALKEDLDARAVPSNRIGAQVVDYDGLLGLFRQYPLIVHS